jgi:transcriptional regulator with XRE-family HTH domain
MTQRELARASGIDQAEISRIERGQANPTVQTLQALGAPLGVVLDFAAS